MRIVHLSARDLRGGAALAAYRLHRGMVEAGLDSHMLVRDRASGDERVNVARLSSSLTGRLGRRAQKFRRRKEFKPYLHRRGDLEMWGTDLGTWRSEVTAQLADYDVVNLHWVHGMVDYPTFFQRVPPRMPVVWTFHDMSVFTGGCVYDWGCGKYRDRCGECPALASSLENDLSRTLWERKAGVFSGLQSDRLHVVALNDWMARQVAESSLLGKFGVTRIPNGVDTDQFQSIDPGVARQALGVGGDRRTIAFVAEKVGNERKGFAHLLDVLGRLKARDDLHLLVVGGGGNGGEFPVPATSFGFVESSDLLSIIYSAADLFVIPSLEDNQPNTIMEAMSCGTPVVAFDTGGVPEIVFQDETGRVVPRGDTAAMAATIEHLLDGGELPRMRATSRRTAEERFSRAGQVDAYAGLYRNLLGRGSHAG